LGIGPFLYQAVGAASRDLKISRPTFIICCFYGVLQFPAIFLFNALPWFGAAPTAWYKRGRFTGNTGYKLAVISQPVFSGTRTKLANCPPRVEYKASLSNTNLNSPLPIDTLTRPLPAPKRHIGGACP